MGLGAAAGTFTFRPLIGVAVIRRTIATHAGGACEAHDLRARHAGRQTFVDFHLVVPGAMSVEEAHAICDRIEEALGREIPDVQVSIHIEPGHKAKHSGVPVMTFGSGP